MATRWLVVVSALPLATHATIPKVLWQTVANASRLTPAFLAQRRRTLKANPGWRVEVLDDAALERFAASELDDTLRRTFASMNPAVGAARADFMRYALLWVRGGVYLDADCCVRGPLDAWLRGGAGLQLLYEPRQFPYHAPPRTDDPDERDIAARAGRVFAHLRARGVASEPGGAHSLLPLVVAQWFLAARPRHPVLGAALARVARSYDAWADDGDALALEARFKVVYLTGPALFNAVLRDDAGGDVDVLGVVEKPGRPWDAWVAEAYGDRRVAGLVDYHCLADAYEAPSAGYANYKDLPSCAPMKNDAPRCPGMAVPACYGAYCRAHADLRAALCGGGACDAAAEIQACGAHWRDHGAAEGREPNPETCSCYEAYCDRADRPRHRRVAHRHRHARHPG